MRHYNELTPAEAERLAMLAEECAEAIQVVGKILRHGYESRDPTKKGAKTNRELLGAELLDVYTVVQMMLNAEDVPYHEANEVAEARERKTRYTHHQSKP